MIIEMMLNAVIKIRMLRDTAAVFNREVNALFNDEFVHIVLYALQWMLEYRLKVTC
jgi:hypothetical protein